MIRLFIALVALIATSAFHVQNVGGRRFVTQLKMQEKKSYSPYGKPSPPTPPVTSSPSPVTPEQTAVSMSQENYSPSIEMNEDERPSITNNDITES